MYYKFYLLILRIMSVIGCFSACNQNLIYFFELNKIPNIDIRISTNYNKAYVMLDFFLIFNVSNAV